MGLRYWPKATSGSNISKQNGYRISYKLLQTVQILTLLSTKGQCLGLIYFKSLPKMRMSEKCNNNNSDNPLTSRRTDWGINDCQFWHMSHHFWCDSCVHFPSDLCTIYSFNLTMILSYCFNCIIVIKMKFKL